MTTLDLTPPSTKTIPSYLYSQYADDADLQAFVLAYNLLAQECVTWMDQTGILVPIYTRLEGDFLTWVGANLYGIPRPLIKPSGEYYDGSQYDIGVYDVTLTAGLADDDTYKKLLTWFIYKGDGRIFSILNLKRRITRWLTGDGVHIDSTSQVSITPVFDSQITIKLPITNPNSETFRDAWFSNVLDLPVAYDFEVILV